MFVTVNYIIALIIRIHNHKMDGKKCKRGKTETTCHVFRENTMESGKKSKREIEREGERSRGDIFSVFGRLSQHHQKILFLIASF